MTRVLSIAALVLAAAIFVPMMIDTPVEAAPQILHPGVIGQPGYELAECPWIAEIEIIDCNTGAVIGWRVKSISSQSLCSAAIQELTQNATQIHHECVGGSSCVEYRWCED